MRTLLFLFLLSLLSLDANSQTLHAIMVSDVEDPKLGGVSLIDEGKILKILKTAESGTGLKLKIYPHNRANFTASAIRETLKSLPVQPKDVVFFYYTGLGYYPDANSQFPAFKLKENSLQRLLGRMPPLSLDEVGNMLQERGARLNVVMADCRDRAEDLVAHPKPFIKDEDVTKVFWKKLFLGSCGLVKVASAGKGKPVWANQVGGSVFTIGFADTIESLLLVRFTGVRQATWPEVVKGAQSIEIWPYPRIRYDPRPLDTQNAVYEIKGCTANQRRNTTPYATYRYSMTAGEISEELNVYAHASNGTNVEELSDRIGKAFRPNAKIKLIRKNKYPSSDSRAKQTVELMSIEAYFAHFKIVSDRIVEVKVNPARVERNPNYESIIGLTITEAYDEL